VPTELSVVGFDDSPLARRLTPPLSTIAQDVVAKGAHAAEELIKAVRRRRAGEPDRVRRHLLPTELVVRGSTAPSDG
jgi:DNA-binding LacI/PurR family transcriptional regulator